MRRSLAIAAVALLPLTLVATVSISSAGAAGQDTSSCTITFPAVSVNPPLGLKGTSDGAFHSIRPGKVDCGGSKGTAEIDGRYGVAKPADCATGGDGWGVMRIKLGKETFGDTFTVRFGANVEGQDAGHTKGERVDTKYVFLGTEGDCVTGPIKVGSLTMNAKIRPAG